MSTWWRNYAGSVAFVAVLVAGIVGFTLTEDVRHDGCEVSNRTVQGLRETQIGNKKAARRALESGDGNQRQRASLHAAIRHADYLLRERYIYIDCHRWTTLLR